jgi:hypothetical protein
MDTDLAPIDVALHWPFIRKHLQLDRRPAARRALEALAVQQLAADGHAVRFGTKFWLAAGMTPGEAGRTTTALRELEDQRVVARYQGRGRLGDSWTFVPSVRHWTAMPWIGSGRSVETAVASCSCRAVAPISCSRQPITSHDLGFCLWKRATTGQTARLRGSDHGFPLWNRATTGHQKGAIQASLSSPLMN